MWVLICMDNFYQMLYLGLLCVTLYLHIGNSAFQKSPPCVGISVFAQPVRLFQPLICSSVTSSHRQISNDKTLKILATLKSVLILICALISVDLLEAPWQVERRREGVIGKNGNKAQGHQCTLQSSLHCSMFNIFSEFCF